MKLRYLESATPGLNWLKKYFHDRPQLDRAAALKNFDKAKQLIKTYPEAGELFEDFLDVREVHVTRTPFSVLYLVHGGTVFIAAIRDGRGQRASEAQRDCARELRAKYRIVLRRQR